MNECQRAIYLCRVFGNFVLSKSSVINCHGVQDQSKQNDRQTFTGLATEIWRWSKPRAWLEGPGP